MSRAVPDGKEPDVASASTLRSTVLVRGEQSEGRVSIMENVVPAHNPGPPLHRHDFDEAFYMLDGELIFQVDDELFTRRAGEVAFAPRGVAHALANRGDGDARYLLVCAPAGLERLFARMTAASEGVDPPDWALQPAPEVIEVGPQIGHDGEPRREA
jgi:quercetin dioxygenase-like cupin family protein